MQGNTIYHVVFNGEHSYFGSITAIFDVFTPNQLGINKTPLWNYKLTPTRPYKNNKCTIYKGAIIRCKSIKQKDYGK